MRPRLRTTPAHGPALRRSGRTRHVSSCTTDLPAERVLLAGQATWQAQLEFRHLTDDGAPPTRSPAHSARTRSRRSHHASSPRNAGGTHDMHTHIHHRHTPSSPGQEGGTTRDNTPNRSGHMLLRDRPLLRPRDDIVEPHVERLSPASAPRVIVPSGRTLGPSCFNTWVKGVDA